jgi:maltose O-acetyltransferase
MKSEKEKMLSGELYMASDPVLTAERIHARQLVKSYNDAFPEEVEKRTGILEQLLGKMGKGSWIEPPFYCDYGYNILLGEGVFFNFNCVFLDVMPVVVGDRAMAGPNVQFYTATHPIDAKERASLLEYAKPIEIGEDVWIGGSSVICPGVKIGPRSIIGAGSVVTKDIPADVIAAGNPCRVIRVIGGK